MMPKKLILKERKLGRERAAGQAFRDDGLIEIDPRLTPRQWLSGRVPNHPEIVAWQYNPLL
jgi:hypothetical protein